MAAMADHRAPEPGTTGDSKSNIYGHLSLSVPPQGSHRYDLKTIEPL